MIFKMKKFSLNIISGICLILFSFLNNYQKINAQTYNNEWIVYGQDYYKIKVVEEGIYHIPYTLIQSQTLWTDVNGSDFMLFKNGQQVPIYVSTLGGFTNSDYIAFFGEGNDGSMDSDLYVEENWQLNPYKSLFNDTAVYYLTVNPAISAKQHYQNVDNDLTDLPETEAYCFYTSHINYSSFFSKGKPGYIKGKQIHFADFEESEGFTSGLISTGVELTFKMNTPAVYMGTDAPFPIIKSKITGMNDVQDVLPDHHVTIKLNGKEKQNLTFDGFDNVALSFNVFVADLTSPQSDFTIHSVGDLANKDFNSIPYLQIQYPRQFDFDGAGYVRFGLDDVNMEKYLEIQNFNTDNQKVFLYDLSNAQRMEAIAEDGLLKCKLPAGNNDKNRDIVLVNESNIKTVDQLIHRSFTDFNKFENQGDFVIIAPSKFKPAVEEYAKHRRSLSGGLYDVAVIYTEELYDQFAYGIDKHPLAIRQFINYGLQHFDSIPSHLLLIGKAIPYNQWKEADNYERCLVPSYGTNPSDNMLAIINSNFYLPQVAVGRLPVENINQLNAYLEKVKQYDADLSPLNCKDDMLWRKNYLNIIQSNYISESKIKNPIGEGYQSFLENSGFHANTVDTFKVIDTEPIDYPAFDTLINKGLGLITYIGNTGETEEQWHINISEADKLTNEGRYPFIMANTNKLGNIHLAGDQSNYMAFDYVFHPQKGAIAYWDNAQTTYHENAGQLSQQIIEYFAEEDYGQSFGHAFVRAIEDFYISDFQTEDDFIMKSMAQFFTLTGDPALVVSSRKAAEYLTSNEEVTYWNPANGHPILSNPQNCDGTIWKIS